MYRNYRDQWCHNMSQPPLTATIPIYLPITCTLRFVPDDDFIAMANARLQQVIFASMRRDIDAVRVRILFDLNSQPTVATAPNDYDRDQTWYDVDRSQPTRAFILKVFPGQVDYFLPRQLILRLLIATLRTGEAHEWFRRPVEESPFGVPAAVGGTDLRLGDFEWGENVEEHLRIDYWI